MKKTILLLILFLLPSLVYAIKFEDKSYILSLYYNKGVITNESIDVSNSPSADNRGDGDYILNIISVKGGVLHLFNFDFPLRIDYIPPPDLFDEEGNQRYIPKDGGMLDESYQTLTFPYFSEASEIKIYKDSELKLTIDINEFNRCNLDGVCQIERAETDKWCPEDCKKPINVRTFVIMGAIVVSVFIISLLLIRRVSKK